MLFNLSLPKINPHMAAGLVETFFAEPGRELRSGEKLLDVSVNLNTTFEQDCPPISYYRLVVRERVWLRRVDVKVGELCELGAPIALFSSLPDEADDGPVERALRIATAGIMFHADMWSGRDR